METIRNHYIKDGLRKEEPTDITQVRDVHKFDKYSLAGICPFCKNYLVQRTSRRKCKLCNREVTWKDLK